MLQQHPSQQLQATDSRQVQIERHEVRAVPAAAARCASCPVAASRICASSDRSPADCAGRNGESHGRRPRRILIPVRSACLADWRRTRPTAVQATRAKPRPFAGGPDTRANRRFAITRSRMPIRPSCMGSRLVMLLPPIPIPSSVTSTLISVVTGVGDSDLYPRWFAMPDRIAHAFLTMR